MPEFLCTTRERWTPLYYQAAVYFTLSMLDDPAMLALIFC